MATDRTRIAAWILIVGAGLATAGYLAASLLPGADTARLTDPLWVPLNSTALAGDLLVGLVALGVAALRAGTCPRWVGIAFLISPVSSFLPVTGPLQLLSDYFAYAAIVGVAVHLLRAPRRELATAG